ncbi:hypothetical protein R6Q59_024287 [Mikania micrantha]
MAVQILIGAAAGGREGGVRRCPPAYKQAPAPANVWTFLEGESQMNILRQILVKIVILGIFPISTVSCKVSTLQFMTMAFHYTGNYAWQSGRVGLGGSKWVRDSHPDITRPPSRALFLLSIKPADMRLRELRGDGRCSDRMRSPPCRYSRSPRYTRSAPPRDGGSRSRSTE